METTTSKTTDELCKEAAEMFRQLIEMRRSEMRAVTNAANGLTNVINSTGRI